MSFTEINIFGVYVSPICEPAAVAWVAFIGLRRLALRFGLLNFVWHPPVLSVALYMILLSSIALMFTR
jgi:protein AaeX